MQKVRRWFQVYFRCKVVHLAIRCNGKKQSIREKGCHREWWRVIDEVVRLVRLLVRQITSWYIFWFLHHIPVQCCPCKKKLWKKFFLNSTITFTCITLCQFELNLKRFSVPLWQKDFQGCPQSQTALLGCFLFVSVGRLNPLWADLGVADLSYPRVREQGFQDP